MSFLAPLFLLGTLAVAGPILFHLIRRTTRDVTLFSSLMFLQPTPPRVTRRSRLEDFWLLLLRCLVVALLALAFARPLARHWLEVTPSPSDGGKRIAILLDRSASMRREKLWEDARRKVEDLLRKSAPRDEMAILTFDDKVRTVLSFAEWKQMEPETRVASANERISTLAPGWGNTRLDTALATAAELFAESFGDRSAPGEIIVISDLQEGAHLDALQAYEWPRMLSVTLAPVAAQQAPNAALQWLTESEEVAGSPEAEPLRVRVSNTAEAKREQFHIQWRGTAAPEAEETSLEVYVPAGQSRIVKPPKPPPGATALVLSGDESDFDNTLFILPPQPVQTLVLFLGNEAPEDPHGSLYYLRRAFPATQRQSVEIVALAGNEPVSAPLLEKVQLAVLGDGVSGAMLDSLREFARGGKIVIAPLTSSGSAGPVSSLLNEANLSAVEAPVKDYALLAQIDFQHPLFASFADPRFSDFTKIHFWKYRRLDLSTISGARVLAAFDSGDPALIEAPLGKGSVVIFTSSWRPADSQLALSSKFVPLLQALLERSSNVPLQNPQYFVGDEVSLAARTGSHSVLKPDGTDVSLGAGTRFTGTDQPGIYTLEPGGQRFVVNLAPEESRTLPLRVERLASLGVPLTQPGATSSAQAANRQALAQAAEIENRQKLWRWLLGAALGALLLETLIAARITRLLAPSQASSI